ncbi:MAG: MarR family winged helix-turn-helix transcriptional regulator [Pseudohongiellaceae bacterium]
MKNDTANLREAKEPELLFRYFTELGIIAQLSSSLFESVLPNGLTNAQFGVLNWFSRVDSEASPGRLATAFQVTKGAMTNTLKKLEAKQLIEVSPDPNSGRKKRVTLTSKGKQQREQALALAGPLFEELSSQLDTEALGAQLPDLENLRIFLDERRYR